MANRYWVGGSGTWSSTTKWSATSGGTSGASVPTSSDDVFFDANSFTSTGQTVTISSAANCKNMNWEGCQYSPAISASNTIIIYGSLKFIPNMSISITSNYALRFYATTTCNTLDFGNLDLSSITGGLFFNGSGGEWTFQSDVNLGTRTFNISTGTVNTNGYKVTCGGSTCNYSNIHTLNLGSSTIEISGDFNANDTNFTLNAGTSLIKFTNTINATLYGGGKTWNNIEVTNAQVTISQSNTFNNLTIAKGRTVVFASTSTQTINGNLFANGEIENIVTLKSDTITSPFTLSKLNGLLVADYCSIQDCTATGGASYYAINSTNVSGNTGWTFNPSVTPTSPPTNLVVTKVGTGIKLDWADSSGDELGFMIYKKVSGSWNLINITTPDIITYVDVFLVITDTLYEYKICAFNGVKSDFTSSNITIPSKLGTLKTNLADMNVGDYISCKYVATSGAVGTFSNLGGTVDTEISLGGSATPSGYFYFMKTDKGTLVADRVIQHSISWDTLNTGKLIQGLPQTFSTVDCLIRSLSTGNSYIDASGNSSTTDQSLGAFPNINEYDVYIVNSTLKGTITAGDDNVWHWSNLYSWGQETPITTIGANTNRIYRGKDSVKALGQIVSSTANTTIGFRPVLNYRESSGTNGTTLWF